jgi:hypothetical protein
MYHGAAYPLRAHVPKLLEARIGLGGNNPPVQAGTLTFVPASGLRSRLLILRSRADSVQFAVNPVDWQLRTPLTELGYRLFP